MLRSTHWKTPLLLLKYFKTYIPFNSPKTSRLYFKCIARLLGNLFLCLDSVGFSDKHSSSLSIKVPVLWLS